MPALLFFRGGYTSFSGFFFLINISFTQLAPVGQSQVIHNWWQFNWCGISIAHQLKVWIQVTPMPLRHRAEGCDVMAQFSVLL